MTCFVLFCPVLFCSDLIHGVNMCGTDYRLSPRFFNYHAAVTGGEMMMMMAMKIRFLRGDGIKVGGI